LSARTSRHRAWAAKQRRLHADKEKKATILPTHTQNPHPMDSPRFAISLAFFGAFGVGLALMSPSLFIVGSIICYASALGTIIRYWRDLKSIFTGTIPAQRLEIVAILFLVIIEILVPTYLVVKKVLWVPDISFQKFSLFWIRSADDYDKYQLGIVAKLFNEEGESYRIKNLDFAGNKVTWIPRGGYTIQRYAVFPSTLEIIIDDEIKANDIKYVSLLLPIFFNMKIDGGSTMDVEMAGKWKLHLDKYTINVEPR
jgi:hypothetical protein